MIQDISPKQFHNTYHDHQLTSNAIALVYRDNEILLIKRDGSWQLPLVCEVFLETQDNEQPSDHRFAFAIDEQAFFLITKQNQVLESETLQFHSLQMLRTLRPMWMAFAGITGSQLFRFYEKTKYCGRCGCFMVHSPNERAMTCTNCKNIVYPTISPAVIVAITKQDKLLMTKYANREYTNYALVAGFVEIGETLEQCVAREVKEEVGIEVTNIRYYKSQPWSFSDSLLTGFFAECKGSDEIFLDTNELSTAEWISRENIPPRVNDISLTQEMIEAFRNQEF